jgi:catechol 2,3-dioxygenase-like lactoylglutathione lyase family enzyme
MGIRVQGLDHVALAVGDQRATASWYRDVLASGILEACSNGRRGGLSEMACSQQSAVVAEIVRGTFGRDLAVRDDDAAGQRPPARPRRAARRGGTPTPVSVCVRAHDRGRRDARATS